MIKKRPLYPFSALVGQERLKQALILNTVNPLIGRVLIRGEKGTAKSTAARGLAELLPPMQMVAGCPFHCDPEAPEVVARIAAARGEKRGFSVLCGLLMIPIFAYWQLLTAHCSPATGN